MNDEEGRLRERIKKRLYPNKANEPTPIGNSSPASTPAIGALYSESRLRKGSSTSSTASSPPNLPKKEHHSTRARHSRTTPGRPLRKSSRIQSSSVGLLSEPGWHNENTSFEVKFLSFTDSPEDPLEACTWKQTPNLNYRLEFNDSKKIFEPYNGIENLTNRGPQFVLDESWDGKAYYDEVRARFEVFKTCGSRLRIEFMNQHGTVSFMQCFSKWFERLVESIVEWYALLHNC